MKSLLVLVATCAAVLQAGLAVQEWWRPSLGLLRSLRSQDVAERRDAGRSLSALGPEDVRVALPMLVAALGDRDAEARENIFQALGKAVVTAAADPANRREVRAAVAAVLAALTDSDEATRLAAAGLLTQFASWPGGGPKLIDDSDTIAAQVVQVALNDRSSRVQAQAANGLFAIAKESSVTPPIELAAVLAAPDRPGDVRGMAAVLLASFPAGHSSAFPLLVESLGDRDPRVRRGAALGLALCGPAAIRPAIPALLAVLAEPVADPPRIPDEGVAVHWLSFPAYLGFEALSVRSRNQRPFPVDESWDPAGAAMVALTVAASGDSTEDRVIAALARTLLADPHPWRRLAAASALRTLGPKAAQAAPALMEALARAIGEPEPVAPNLAITPDLIMALTEMAPGSAVTPAHRPRSQLPNPTRPIKPVTGSWPSFVPALIDRLVEALDSSAGSTVNAAIVALGEYPHDASAALPKLRALAAGGNIRVQELAAGAITQIDAARYDEAKSQAIAIRAGDRLTLGWPTAPGETGRLILNLAAGQPLFAWGDLVAGSSNKVTPLMDALDPAAFLVVGSRVNPPPTPPEMSVFNVFFDSPAQRPHQTYRVAWAGPKVARVISEGARATVAVGPIEAGPFRGEWVITVYAGTRLVHVEAVMKTTEDARAITYDAGLVSTVSSDRPKPIPGRAAGLDRHRRADGTASRSTRTARTNPTPSGTGPSVLEPKAADRSPASRRRTSTSSPATTPTTSPPPGRAGSTAAWHRASSASASASPRPAAGTTPPGSTPRPGPTSAWGSSTSSTPARPRRRWPRS